MILYYCYFGDAVNGQNLVKILFGDVKVNPFFEEKLNPHAYSTVIEKILIRYFVDGNVSQYAKVKENKIFYSRKKQCLSADFHVGMQKMEQMNLSECFCYVKDTTIQVIHMIAEYCSKKTIDFDNVKLEIDVCKLFDYIHTVVVERAN